MKKIILFFFPIMILNICFANGNPYQKTLSSREKYVSSGIRDISSYLVETTSDANQKQGIKNSTQTVIFDIKNIIQKNESLINQGTTINAKAIQRQIEGKINDYKAQLKKYSSSSEIETLISDFQNGLNNIYIANFQKSNDDGTLDFKKQNKYYNKIYQKVKNILTKYPGEKYKDFLGKLSNKIENKKKEIINSKMPDSKKTKYISLYETLEIVIEDFQK